MKAWSNAIVVEQIIHNRYKMDYKSLRKYECPEDLFDLCIAPCWNYEVDARPTFQTLVDRLDYFTGNREDLPIDADTAKRVETLEIQPSGFDVRTYPNSAVNRNIEERINLPCMLAHLAALSDCFTLGLPLTSLWSRVWVRADFFGEMNDSATDDVLMNQIGETNQATDDYAARHV
jgi:hypothetical protein